MLNSLQKSNKVTIKIYENSNPWIFFILTLSISWFFWMWIILSGWNVWKVPGIIFGALGLFGPTFAEIFLISKSNNKERWKDYWHRVFSFKQIGKKWFLIIIIIFPLIHAIITLASLITGTHLPSFETAKNLISNPWKILPFAIFVLLFGPIPEELGWRGYALDGLQTKYNALVSSFILGTVWSFWHIPLFFIKGTFQYEQLKFGTLDFWLYILGPIIISILFTWIYNNTNRSTLSAILFHFTINFTGELIPLTERGRIYSLILITLLSIVIVITMDPKTLAEKAIKISEI
ncbi:CPBP family intramembrane metalloprotease [Thermosipho ferrireducens]|uniref:CPBP family intramembrane metalloprotease n=1 Tax=Thermosipho ferrireducens TaxID=2571116 RepID=A0ABX7S9M2_9BACT|nr:type II CAAX endopeptidase family protein [Thermosipho ferrireducens]QTA38570.1 CPBP family intramembrane metalloprotease [Thermosipho ferrireducens]